MKTVEIDGITIEVADDAVAEKLIAKRQETKEKTRSLAAELEETRAKIAAIDKEKADQLADEKVKSLADKKKFDEALATVKASSEARIKTLSESYLNAELRASVAANPEIVPSAVDDVVSLIRGACTFDLDAKVVRVLDGSSPKLGEDGAPMKVDAFINETLAARPHFRKATATSGSGGASGAGGTKVGQTISNEAFLAMSPTQRAASLPKKP
jgi:hypothetical protein